MQKSRQSQYKTILTEVKKKIFEEVSLMVEEEKAFLREEERPLSGCPAGRKAFKKCVALLKRHQGSH